MLKIRSKNMVPFKSVFVLGGTSDISKEICLNLAKKGVERFHLVSKNTEKNQLFINELRKSFKVKVTSEEVNILKRSTAAAERGAAASNIIGTEIGFDKDTQYNTIIDQSMGQIWFYREVNGIISVRIPIDSNTTLRSENEGKENLITVGDGQSIVIIIRQGG